MILKKALKFLAIEEQAASTEVHQPQLEQLLQVKGQTYSLQAISDFYMIATHFGTITYRKNFKIILINNGGGGIFRILPGHDETPVFNTFFETSHCLTAEHLCKMYGLNYLTASTETTLEESLKAMFSNDEKPTLLEVFTPTLENDKVLLQYFRELV